MRVDQGTAAVLSIIKQNQMSQALWPTAYNKRRMLKFAKQGPTPVCTLTEDAHESEVERNVCNECNDPAGSTRCM